MEGGLRLAEPVEAPEPLLAYLDQPCPMEVAKVARNSRLRQLQNRHDVAHAHLSVLQEMQDSEPRTVREGAEHPLDLRR